MTFIVTLRRREICMERERHRLQGSCIYGPFEHMDTFPKDTIHYT